MTFFLSNFADDGGVKNDWRLFCMLNMTKIKVIAAIVVAIILTIVGVSILTLTLMQQNQSPVKFIIPQFEKSSKILRARRDTGKNAINREDEMKNFLNEKYAEIKMSDSKILKRGTENTIQKLAMEDLLRYNSYEKMLVIEDDLWDIEENFKEIEHDVDALVRLRRSKRDVESKSSSFALDPITMDSFLTQLEEKRREKRLAQRNLAEVREDYIRCKKSTNDGESTKCDKIYQNLKTTFNEITEKLREIDEILKEIEQREKVQVAASLASEEDIDHERKKSKDKKKKKDKKKESSEESAESHESHETTKNPHHNLVTSTSTTEQPTTTTVLETTEIPTTTFAFEDETTTILHEVGMTESCPASLNDEVRRHPMIAEELGDFNHKFGHEIAHHKVEDFHSKRLMKNIANQPEEAIVGRIIDIYGLNKAQPKNRKMEPMVSGPFMALCDQMSKQKQSLNSQNSPFSNFPTTAEASKGSSKVVMNSGFSTGGVPICFVNYPQPQSFVYPVAPIYAMQPQMIYPTAFAGGIRPSAGVQYASPTYRAEDATTFCTFDASNNGNLPVHFQSTTETPSIDERRDDSKIPTPFDVIFATFPNQMIMNFNRSTRHNNCDDGKISCFTTSQCIPKSSWCDSNVDCLDASDETACSCKSRLHESRICDGYFDCPMGDDELGCFECDKFQFSCYSSADEFQANSGGGLSCYSTTEKCDGFMNCKNGRDESDCSILVRSIGPIVNPFLVGQSEGVLHRNYKGKWYLVCDGPDSWLNEVCDSEIGQKTQPRIELRALNIEGPFISEIDMTPTITDNCKLNTEKNNVIIVRCNKPKCGSSKLLEKEVVSLSRREKEGEMEVGAVRIVGGIDALPMEFPFMVAIFKDGNFHCGGSIFNENWIITAAHCLRDATSHFYEIRAGILRRSSFSPQSQITSVTHAIPHENYEPHTMANDIALMRVKTPFTFNRWVRPVCIPKVDKSPKNIPPPKTICTTIGWGALKERGPDRKKLLNLSL